MSQNSEKSSKIEKINGNSIHNSKLQHPPARVKLQSSKGQGPLQLYELPLYFVAVSEQGGIPWFNQGGIYTSKQQNSKKKNKNFYHAVIQLLDNTNPSAKFFPVDMQRVDYNIIAMYLSSMKTEEGNYKGMSNCNGAWSLMMYLMKQDNVHPRHLRKRFVIIWKVFA